MAVGHSTVMLLLLVSVAVKETGRTSGPTDVPTAMLWVIDWMPQLSFPAAVAVKSGIAAVQSPPAERRASEEGQVIVGSFA